jgi:hypothetical protein
MGLNIGQLWQLSLLFLKNLFLVFPTLKATKKTFAICNDLFGQEHQKSNRANAFRHIIWNILICKNSMQILKNKQKSVFWAQKLTDLYEKVTQNEVLDEDMDLHNNAVGRMYFLNLIDKSEAEIIDYVMTKMKNAQKVTAIQEMSRFKTSLVYIE